MKNSAKYPIRQPKSVLPLFRGKKISLWDMIQFAINNFIFDFLSLRGFQQEIESRIEKDGEFSELTTAEKKQAEEIFNAVSNHFYVVEPSKSNALVLSMHLSPDEESDIKFLRDLKIALRKIEDAIESDFLSLNLAIVQPPLTKFFEEKTLFGKKVNRNFPSSRADIKDAGNCLAVDLNTAAVFHLMRVMEFGLRALSVHLGIKKFKKKPTSKPIPIDLGTWEEIIVALNEKLAALRTKARSKKREVELDFYNELLGELRSVKDLMRNKVMHARVIYDHHQAKSAFDHVKAFMQRLATRVSETN